MHVSAFVCDIICVCWFVKYVYMFFFIGHTTLNGDFRSDDTNLLLQILLPLLLLLLLLVVVVFVVFLTLTHRCNAVRGHSAASA